MAHIYAPILSPIFCKAIEIQVVTCTSFVPHIKCICDLNVYL